MGLSASQGRLLMLTARKSDTELRAQQISQQRLILANQTEEVTRKYTESTSNRMLMFKKPNPEGQGMISTRLTVDDIQSMGAGYRLVDANGNEYGDSAFMESLGDLNLDTPEHLEYALNNGIIFIEKKSDEQKTNDSGYLEDAWIKQSIAGMSNITDQYDTSDDSEAEAIYQLEKTKIQNKDKRLELDLKQVETQHKAIETEVESVQKVIQKNVETSFKTFS